MVPGLGIPPFDSAPVEVDPSFSFGVDKGGDNGTVSGGLGGEWADTFPILTPIYKIKSRSQHSLSKTLVSKRKQLDTWKLKDICRYGKCHTKFLQN